MSLAHFQTVSAVPIASNFSGAAVCQSGGTFAVTGSSQLYVQDGVVTITPKSPAFVFGEQVVGPAVRKVTEIFSFFWNSFLTFPGADGAVIDQRDPGEFARDFGDQIGNSQERALFLANWGKTHALIDNMATLRSTLLDEYRKELSNIDRCDDSFCSIIEGLKHIAKDETVTVETLTSLSGTLPTNLVKGQKVVDGAVWLNGGKVIVYCKPSNSSKDLTFPDEPIPSKSFSDFSTTLERAKELLLDETVQAYEERYKIWESDCRKMVDEKIASAYAKALIKNEGLRVEAKQVLDEICTRLKCKVNVEHSNGFSVNPEGRSYGVALLAGVIFPLIGWIWKKGYVRAIPELWNLNRTFVRNGQESINLAYDLLTVANDKLAGDPNDANGLQLLEVVESIAIVLKDADLQRQVIAIREGGSE